MCSSDLCRFIKQKHRCVFQHRPGYGETLALPPRQFHPLFADHGVVSVGQVDDEIMGGGVARGAGTLPPRAGRGGVVVPPLRHLVREPSIKMPVS